MQRVWRVIRVVAAWGGAALGAAGWGAGLGGCVSRIAASADREEAGGGAGNTMEPVRWPERSSAWVEAALLDGPMELNWFVGPEGPTDGGPELRRRLFERVIFLPPGAGRVESVRRAGVGVVREVTREWPSASAGASLRRHRAFASWSAERPRMMPVFGSIRAGHEKLAQNRDVLEGLGLRVMDPEVHCALDEGMPFHLDPAWVHSKGFVRPEGTPTLGVLFSILGSSGVDADDEALFDELVRRGWRVVLIPTGRGALLPETAVWLRDAEPESLDRAGEALARHFDELCAEMAYIVEGALADLDATEPELTRKPVVLLAYSAGAMAAPAVAARLEETSPGRLAGMVLVAGGSNLLGIALESVATRPTLYVRWDPWSEEGRWSAGARRGLLEAYLRHTRLDPAAVGPRVRHVPALVVKAKVDWAVPGWSTDRLYHDLGGPDWWSYAAGHISVLKRLAGDRERVAEWLEGAVAQRRGTSGAIVE